MIGHRHGVTIMRGARRWMVLLALAGFGLTGVGD
jgi:hypothetical protein